MVRAIAFDFFGVLHDSATDALNPRVLELVQRLHPEYKIAIISNSSLSFLERFLTWHQARQHFDAIVASHDVGHSKPHPGIFADCARRLNVGITEMLFIDDSPGHVAAATAYGIPSVLYQNPIQLEEDVNRLLR